MIKLYLACNGVLHDDSWIIPKSYYQLKQIDDYKLVKKISLIYCRINSITDDCFEGLEHLEQLSLLGIEVERLKAYQFNRLVSLKHLYLRYSKIVIIEGFFQSPQLKSVIIDAKVQQLQNNRIIRQNEIYNSYYEAIYI